MDFDKRLLALCNCPVFPHNPADPEASGGTMFNPYPVITATNNNVLAHELCHLLGGKREYDIFVTAVIARDNDQLFKCTLNLLYDWYHERKYEILSGFMAKQIDTLHEYPLKLSGHSTVDTLIDTYNRRISITEGEQIFKRKIKGVLDLVVLADKINKKIPSVKRKKVLKILINGLCEGAGNDIGKLPERYNYYINAVTRYYPLICSLSDMWIRNKYAWINNYYGEIDWKNLPRLMLGNEMVLPIFRILSKIMVSRSIYLVIDRSGSTHEIKDMIMDTAVIITESLRQVNTPISILDVGVTDSIVNKITEDIDLLWFTPMSGGGTPLGEVCSQIRDADFDSYLLIITDGLPNCWNTLLSALHSFPGESLTFVIGPDYNTYMSKIKNAVSVQPNTIVQEVAQNEQFFN